MFAMFAQRAAARQVSLGVGILGLLAGCASTPLGPTVQVMPGPGRSFEAFQADQSYCQYYATQRVQGQADAANQRAAGTAVLGTLLGAGLGAAVGSVGGNVGAGAAIGAAAGAATGTAYGANGSTIRPVRHPAAIRQRLCPVHVCQGRSGAGLRATRHL